MTITLELSAEIEDALTAMAIERGVALPEIIRSLLESQVVRTTRTTIEERISAWRDLPREIPVAPPLSDEAVSRSSIYGGL